MSGTFPRSDAGEAQTRGPWVSSKALYHWATALQLFDLILYRPVNNFSVMSGTFQGETVLSNG